MQQLKDLYKSAAFVMGGIIVSFVGFYLVESRQYVSREEVDEILSTTAPYIQDRARIVSELKRVDRLEDKLQENQNLMLEIRREVTRLSTIIERSEK